MCRDVRFLEYGSSHRVVGEKGSKAVGLERVQISGSMAGKPPEANVGVKLYQTLDIVNATN